MRNRRRSLCLSLATAVPRDPGRPVPSVRTNVESLIAAMVTGEVGRLNGDDFLDPSDYGWDTQSD